MVAATMHLLDLTFDTLAANLALDEALLLEVEAGRAAPLLRVWEYPHLAVVLGASSRIQENVYLDACLADGVEVARRSSGGGTVLIGPGALNFTVILPVASMPEYTAIDRAQIAVLRTIAAALNNIGAAVDVRGSGDLTRADRKFSGSAQRRLKTHFLIHASLLYQFPLDRIARYTKHPPREPLYRAGRSHELFLTNLDLPRQAILDAIRRAWPQPGPGDAIPQRPEGLVSQLVETKFATRDWIERL